MDEISRKTLKIKVIFGCSLILCLTNCKSVFDDYEDLGNGYKYRNEGSLNHSIYPNNNYKDSKILPTVIDYNNFDIYVTAVQIPNIEMYDLYLGGDLSLRFCWYDWFLKDSFAVKNQFDDFTFKMIRKDSLNYKLLDSYKMTCENSYKDQELSKYIADSLIKQGLIYQEHFQNDTNYWIIKKTEDLIFGPLTRKEYKNKCIELSINDKFRYVK
jgi:hypothetical protein